MSQVNFFMLDEDERDFIASLLERGDTLLIPCTFARTTRPATVTRLPSCRAAPSVTLANATLRPSPRFPERGAGDFAGLRTFDLLRDPYIEVARSRRRGNVLFAGRLYAKVGWLRPTGDNAVHRRWYSSIERWIKTRYRRHDSTWWIAPAAERWSRKGGSLELGDGGRIRSLAARRIW